MTDFNVTVSADGPKCVTKKTKRNNFILKNPVSGECSIDLNAINEPGFLNITIKKINLNEGDSLRYTSLFFTKDLTTANAGDTIYLPTAVGELDYDTTETAVKEGKAFKVRTRFQKNRCHKVIFVPVGTKGRITTPGFDDSKMEKNTYCEWWISSPKGTKIELEFTGFNVGKGKTKDCVNEDFVTVSVKGNKYYGDKKMFCRPTEPEEKKFTSEANKMYVLAYAPNEDGKSIGFSATYEAI